MANKNGRKPLSPPMDSLKKTAIKNLGESLYKTLKLNKKSYKSFCREMNKGYDPIHIGKLRTVGSASKGVILDICEEMGWKREDFIPDDIWKTIENSEQREKLAEPKMINLTFDIDSVEKEIIEEPMTLADELTEVAESKSEIPQEDIDQADLLIDIAAKLVEIEVSLKNVAEGLHNIIEATGDIENILFEKASSLLGVSWKDKGAENDK